MNSTTNLRNISLLAFGFVTIVVLVSFFSTNNYGRANNEVVEELQKDDYIINYFLLNSIVTEQTDKYQLVDLRSEKEYQKEHLPTAINIPLDQLLEKSSLKQIKKQQYTPVFYAGKESVAQTARMLLIAHGLETNIMILGGNFEMAKKYGIENVDPGFAHYKEEKAQFDYNRFMYTGAGTGTSDKGSPPSSSIPSAATPTEAAQGGC